MARNYCISRSGRLARQDNTLYLESETEDGKNAKTPIPIEDVDALYLYGEIDLNTRLLNFLAQNSTPAHVFNYYGYYAGSYYPRNTSIAASYSCSKCSIINRKRNVRLSHRS